MGFFASRECTYVRFICYFFCFFAIFDSGNYEIYLPDISIGHVSFSDLSSRGRGFTMCFWLKTAHSGFFIEYSVAASREQDATLVLGLYFHNHSFDILFGSIRRYNNNNIIDYTLYIFLIYSFLLRCCPVL